MQRRTFTLGCILGVVFVAWGVSVWKFRASANDLSVSTRAVLETGEEFVLLSVEPFPGELHPHLTNPPFHGFQVLGQTTISNAAGRKQLLDALYAGILLGPEGEGARCFNPRHGLKARHGNEQVELLICFECGYARVYAEQEKVIRITGAPAGTFNTALKEAGLVLAE